MKNMLPCWNISSCCTRNQRAACTDPYQVPRSLAFEGVISVVLVLIVDLHETKSRPEASAVVRGSKEGPTADAIDITLRSAAKIFVALGISVWHAKLVVFYRDKEGRMLRGKRQRNQGRLVTCEKYTLAVKIRESFIASKSPGRAKEGSEEEFRHRRTHASKLSCRFIRRIRIMASSLFAFAVTC